MTKIIRLKSQLFLNEAAKAQRGMGVIRISGVDLQEVVAAGIREALSGDEDDERRETLTSLMDQLIRNLDHIIPE